MKKTVNWWPLLRVERGYFGKQLENPFCAGVFLQGMESRYYLCGRLVHTSIEWDWFPAPAPDEMSNDMGETLAAMDQKVAHLVELCKQLKSRLDEVEQLPEYAASLVAAEMKRAREPKEAATLDSIPTVV